MKLILNPKYGIKNESTCSFLCLVDNSAQSRIKYLTPVTEIPPLYGYILSQFNGQELEEIIRNITEQTGISAKFVSKFVTQLINNPNPLNVKFLNDEFILPADILIETAELKKEDFKRLKVFYCKDFDPFNRFKSKRPDMPINVSIMLTTKCYTDCIYCYADRNDKKDFELDRIVSLIEECYQEGAINVTLSGGDVFAHKDWRTVIKKMAECNYVSFISTKIPLNKEDILFLKECGVEDIQFSLDSVDSNELKSIVKVKQDYINQVYKMFDYCQQYNIEINVKSVLSKYNSSLHSLTSLYETINKYNIKIWNVIPAFYSDFKSDFENYSASELFLKEANDYLEELKKDSKLYIYNKILNKRTSGEIKYKTTSEFIEENKGCNAIAYNISINIIGKITVCEMLYNKDLFHLDNIDQHSLKEIWNSKTMTGFYDFQMQYLNQSEDSPCYSCEDFKKCKVGNTKKVCLVDVVTNYGNDKWDYPDPRCPRGPECKMNLIME